MQLTAEIDVKRVGTTTEVTASGDVDMATAGDLSAALGEALDERPETLLVDLSAVGFIDSAGIHALIEMHHRARAVGVTPVVIRPAGVAARAFDATGVGDLFPAWIR